MTFISRETISSGDDAFKVRCHEQLLVVPISPPREVWVVISAEDWSPNTGPNDIDVEPALAFAIATPWVSHSWNGAVDCVTHGYGENGRHKILEPSDNRLQTDGDVLELAQHWVLLPN